MTTTLAMTQRDWQIVHARHTLRLYRGNLAAAQRYTLASSNWNIPQAVWTEAQAMNAAQKEGAP